jgi:hypothetical protein
MTDDLWEILIAGLFANVHFKLKKSKGDTYVRL